jgi:O-antigen/teichoic acid export membrane protein/glycosyltransferase involved in cell wall biosynthesis
VIVALRLLPPGIDTVIRDRPSLPPIISASGAYYVAYALIVLGGLISMPIMTRLLSKSEYGLLGLLYATVSVLAVVGGMGLGEAAVRLYSEQRLRGAAAARELCNALLGGALAAAAVIAVAIAAGALWFGGSRYVECLPLASLLIVIRAVSGVLFQIYRAQERARAHALTQIFQRCGTMVLAIGMLLLFPGDAQTVIAATIIVELVAVAARWIDLGRRGAAAMPTLARPILTTATVYGAPLALAGSARFLLDYGDRLLIERMLGLDAVAMYSVPNDMAIRLGETLWSPIQLAALPIMFRLWESNGAPATSRFGSDVLSYMVALMLPIATIFLVYSEEIIVLLASHKYAGASRLLPYLLPAVLLASMNSIVAVGLTVQKRTARVALNVLGAAVFNIALNLVLIPRWQLVGAAVAASLSQGALLAAHRLAGNALELRLRPRPLLKAAVATAIPVALLYALGRVPSTSIAGLGLNLVCATGAAALIFAALEPRLWRLAWLGGDLLAAAQRADNDSTGRRVLIIGRDFPPAPTSAARRAASFARHLPAAGWKAAVVAISERFHSRSDASEAKRLVDCEVSRAYGFDSKAVFAVRGRYPSLLAFPDREVSWIFDGVRQALRAHRRARADVLLSTSPPVSAHCIAYVVKRFTGLPWIAELRDPWRLEALGPLLRRTGRRLERRLLADADAIVVTTPGMAADLERRCGDGVRGKVRVIPNGFEEEGFATLAAAAPGGFSIAHVGVCAPPYRDPAGFLGAVRSCIDRGDLPADVPIAFVGAADPEASLSRDVARFHLQDQVRVTERVSVPEALGVIGRTPLLLLLQTRRDHNLCVPAKAYEYLRSGAAILAITPPDGETAKLLHAFPGVAVVAPDAHEEIAKALAAAYRSWTNGAARGFVRDVQRYDRRRLAADLAQVLDEVVRRGLPA